MQPTKDDECQEPQESQSYPHDAKPHGHGGIGILCHVLTANDAHGEDDRGNATGSKCAEQVSSSLHDAQADPNENHGDAPYAKDQT